MSIPVLVQVSDEVRRLAIAGSVVACNDFRLRKLVPALEQAGQKAPVFARITQAVKQLVDSDEQTSASALLQLSMLVNAVLYTQGETGIEGELELLPGGALELQPQAPARTLKPLLESLTSSGSGRFEIISDAYQKGLFRDLRLVAPAVHALDDNYPEIADLIADKVLPMYGAAIVPPLRQRLDAKGNRKSDARRLTILHRLDPHGTRPFVEQVLEEGSKEMRIAAIACLGSDPKDISFLIEQSRARSKDVRAAALSVLARCSDEKAVKRMMDAINGADLDLAVDGLSEAARPEVARHIVEQCARQWELVLQEQSAPAEEFTPVLARFETLLSAVKGRQDDMATDLLLRLFAELPRIAKLKTASGHAISCRLAGCLAAGSPAAQRALIDRHGELDGDELAYALTASCCLDTPEQVYERFSPYMEVGMLKRPSKSKREAVITALLRNEGAIASLDPRWVDLAIKQDIPALALPLLRPQHAQAWQYLSKLWHGHMEKNRFHESMEVLSAMLRVEHPDATAAFKAAIDRQAKGTSYSYLAFYYLGPMLSQLPKSALPEIECWLPTLPEKFVDQLMDHVLALRERVEA